MTPSLVFCCLWVLAAAAIAMLPQRWHWVGAGVLVALGIPLLGFATYENGPFVGLVLLAGGMSVLRWPVIHLFRRLRGPAGDA